MSCSSVHRAVLKTPAGYVGLYASGEGVARVVLGDRQFRGTALNPILREALEQLRTYFSGRKVSFSVPLDLGDATPFRAKVWHELMNVAYGKTVSYGELASMCGRPGAARAVGGAVGANPVPILLPCHRVISSDGSLGGFSGGLKWKAFLLELEGAL